MYKSFIIVLAAAASLGLGASADAAVAAATPDDHHEELLERLELGMMALRELGRIELVRELERVADDVRREVDRDRDRREDDHHADRERGVMIEQLEVLRLAVDALREAELGEVAELVHRAIRAREVVLEGRRDREAEQLRRRQPGRKQLSEILGLAERLYREFGGEERADAIARAVDELWRAPREAEHIDALEQIEIMEQACHAMLEAGRRDAAALVERAIAARRVRMDGRRDAEARRILEREPSLGEQIELMQFGADLWARFGHERKAEAWSAALADRLRQRDHGHGEHARGEHGGDEHGEHEHGEHEGHAEHERGGDEHGEHEPHDRDDRNLADRLNRLEEQIAELRRTIARLLEQRRR